MKLGGGERARRAAPAERQALQTSQEDRAPGAAPSRLDGQSASDGGTGQAAQGSELCPRRLPTSGLSQLGRRLNTQMPFPPPGFGCPVAAACVAQRSECSERRLTRPAFNAQCSRWGTRSAGTSVRASGTLL